jgi:hypothetical protein
MKAQYATVIVLLRSVLHLTSAAEQTDGQIHPCQRECRADEPPKTCEYHFKVEWYYTMSKACYDCPYNLTDCYRPDCVPADGVERPIIVINRSLPGPSIQVIIVQQYSRIDRSRCTYGRCDARTRLRTFPVS